MLITSGDLKGNAALSLQAWNEELQRNDEHLPVELWAKDNLIEYLSRYGLSGLLHSTASAADDLGHFLLTYSRALRKSLTEREIEEYSRRWLEASDKRDQFLHQHAIETGILANQCVVDRRFYEAVHCYLSFARFLCAASYFDDREILTEAFRAVTDSISELCKTYVLEFRANWDADRDLVRLAKASMTTYLVHCSRTLELASLWYFTTTNEQDKQDVASFLELFIKNESGCCKPLSDRYAVPLVPVVLALCDTVRYQNVVMLLRNCTIWCCDRYESGNGLASLEADEFLETSTLLGSQFDFFEVTERNSSFLATVLADLSALLGDVRLYSDIVNDLKACEIVCEYWQPQNSPGACNITGEDVVLYPSLDFEDELSSSGPSAYANYMHYEVDQFGLVDRFGSTASVMLAMILRDRYFPKLWPGIAVNHKRLTAEPY